MDRIEFGKNCIITFLPDLGAVQVEWFELPPTDIFRKGCNTVLDLLTEKKVSKVLVDNTHVKLFALKDQHWLNDDWLPRAEKAGYRYSATVLGDSDAFVKFASQSIAGKRDKSKFISKFFKTRYEASEWLKTL